MILKKTCLAAQCAVVTSYDPVTVLMKRLVIYARLHGLDNGEAIVTDFLLQLDMTS